MSHYSFLLETLDLVNGGKISHKLARKISKDYVEPEAKSAATLMKNSGHTAAFHKSKAKKQFKAQGDESKKAADHKKEVRKLSIIKPFTFGSIGKKIRDDIDTHKKASEKHSESANIHHNRAIANNELARKHIAQGQDFKKVANAISKDAYKRKFRTAR